MTPSSVVAAVMHRHHPGLQALRRNELEPPPALEALKQGRPMPASRSTAPSPPPCHDPIETLPIRASVAQRSASSFSTPFWCSLIGLAERERTRRALES